MNVSLTPELEELINQKVKSGMYNSASEVIREGLRRLFKEDSVRPQITETQRLQMDELQREVMKGVEQMRNGQSRRFSSINEMFDEITSQAQAEFEAENKNGKL
jgi:antitoxin ParD1/3/4